MRIGKVVSADEAIALVRDADVLASSGYGGHGVPEHLLGALEARFLRTAAPRRLTVLWAGGQGDGKDRGLNHVAHEGLIARAIGGHFGLTPGLERLAVDDRIEAYNFPEGVIVQLYRDIGAVRRIVETVDATLAPVGHRVNAIVNSESFTADPEVLDLYADAVKYVEERYYLKVSRYSTSAFLRLRLGHELGSAGWTPACTNHTARPAVT